MPPFLSLSIDFLNNIDYGEEFEKYILDHPVVKGGMTFAVRSSAMNEDNEINSFAGIYETYLDVKKENIADKVVSVLGSINSPRSMHYMIKKNIGSGSMGVIIQQMLKPDYAGVYFSVSPVENNRNIALLEVVKGNCDELVSGRKTPASIRINKITQATRIQNSGSDNIDPGIISNIKDLLMPFAKKIEKIYVKPVDIEWAIEKRKVYILQCRYITTMHTK